MATTGKDWLNKYDAAAKDLRKTLTQKDPTYSDVDALLVRVRVAFENLWFSSILLAARRDAESTLWDAHGKVNSRYRRELSKLHDEEGKKRPVERRKLEKHYLDFIKSSMRFYRGYIQRLASHYEGIPELTEVASRFGLDTTSIDIPVKASEEVREIILRSCHATLICLGDLSRYRETELKTKERNWGPAIGYYDLASYINPASGLPHNQLAVIALADGQHVRALYQLYRAHVAAQPHPSAKSNLDIEFKKIIHKRKELFAKGGPSVPERNVEAWFAYIHASCERGEEGVKIEQMENEMLTQLAVLLRERSFESQLQRFTLVNIAAEYVAAQRAREDVDNTASLAIFQRYQRLNLKTFFTLLQILLPELTRDEESMKMDTNDASELITPIARRVLPSLRLYSSWLLSNASYLVAQREDPMLGVHIKEFWRMYSNALTLIGTTFSVERLPEISYLLEEDVDTLGFTPLANEYTSRRYYEDVAKVKPRHDKETRPRELPGVEMLFRIRDMLLDGADLAIRPATELNDQVIPIELIDHVRFVYQEDGLPSEVYLSPSNSHARSHVQSTTSINRDDIERSRSAYQDRNIRDGRKDDDQSTTAGSTSNATMKNMVNNLVDSETPETIPIPPTPLQHTLGPPFVPHASDSSSAALKHSGADNQAITARDLVMGMQRTGTAGMVDREESIRPLTSSIWTPLPGETGSPQTRPGTATANRAFDPAATPKPMQPQSTALLFQDELQRQQHFLHNRSSPIASPETPLSWTGNENNAPFEQYHRPLSKGSPWGRTTMSSTSPFPGTPFSSSSVKVSSTDVPRRTPIAPQFGAIGQIPPSGQDM